MLACQESATRRSNIKAFFMNDAALYRAEVTHARFGRVRHKLRHSVFYLYLDLARLDQVAQTCRFFSYNRFNLISFFDGDHGALDGQPAKAWVEGYLKRAGLYDPQGRIFLLALPRVLGYVFNPLSVYYCFDRDGQLRAVMHEVRNTFGELHGYLLPAVATAEGVVHQEADKHFYVSPFMAMKARYRFRLNLPGKKLILGIRESGADGTGLAACLVGARRSLDDWQILGAVLAMPLMTLKVISSIHLHAVRLWLKGATFHRKPPAPDEAVTLGMDAGGSRIDPKLSH